MGRRPNPKLERLRLLHQADDLAANASLPPLTWLGAKPPSASGDFDLVVTRFRETISWVGPLARDWNVYVYLTSTSAPELCSGSRSIIFCAHVTNKGNEWAGYLSHLVHRYDLLARRTAFVQANPFAVSPDLRCLLAARAHWLSVQALSWVQQGKVRNPVFGCNASFVRGCRVWVDPVNSGFRPLLHGDRWLVRAIGSHLQGDPPILTPVPRVCIPRTHRAGGRARSRKGVEGAAGAVGRGAAARRASDSRRAARSTPSGALQPHVARDAPGRRSLLHRRPQR